MEYIWSPWRMDYIESDKAMNGCVFCREAAKPDGPENLIVARGQLCFAIINRFPYTSGHLMIVPFSHQPSIELLEPAARAEVMELTSKAVTVLQEVYHPEGFNIGINIGSAAGAGIVEHVHLHVVPRWGGDTNFMSSLANTRVLPEALEATWERVKRAWESET